MKAAAVELVHYEVAHPATKRIGTIETPLHHVATACTDQWSTRPRRTGLPRLVTCQTCLAWMAEHYRDVITAVNKLRSVAA